MPKYFEYVFSAYAIWIGVFAAYLLFVMRRSRAVRRALDRLGSGANR
jgi:heme exporter protein CcmD